MHTSQESQRFNCSWPNSPPNMIRAADQVILVRNLRVRHNPVYKLGSFVDVEKVDYTCRVFHLPLRNTSTANTARSDSASVIATKTPFAPNPNEIART